VSLTSVTLTAAGQKSHAKGAKGYKAWVVPIDGKGNLVMDLFLNCRVRRVYPSGGFTLPEDDRDDQ
jgi:hypothetical protein